VPAVQDDRGERREALGRVRGHQGDEDLVPVRGRDDHLALLEPLQHVLGVHARDEEVLGLAAEEGLVAEGQRAAELTHQLLHRCGGEQFELRERPHREAEVVDGGGVGLRGVVEDPVHDDPDDLGVVGVDLVDGEQGGLGDLRRGPVHRADHEEHRGPEVGGDPGVVLEFRRPGDVRVVGAHHDDDVEGVLEGTVLVDDPGERLLGIGVDVVVRHPDALVVGEVGQAREQQFQDTVAFSARAHDRPEHPHVLDVSGEQVHQPKGHRRLAGVTLHRDHVDRARHVATPSKARGGGLVDPLPSLVSGTVTRCPLR